MTDKPLTPKEQRFLDEYLGACAGNGTLAAKAAGYAGSGPTLAVQANRLLKKANIVSAMAERRELTVAAGILTAEECAVMLSGYATGTIEEPAPEGGTQKAKISDRTKAIATLAKIRGYEAPTKTEVTGVVGVMSMTPEVEEALELWMMIRNDPRVRAVIEELRGEV